VGRAILSVLIEWGILTEMSNGSFYDTKEGRFFPALNRSKRSAFFRNFLADRYTHQMYWEETHEYIVIDADEWVKIRTRLRRAGARYKTFPIPDELIIVAREGEVELPVEFKARKQMVDSWLELAPEGSRCGGVHGFGGPWKGSRRNGKSEPGRYIHLFQNTGDVVEVLKMTKVEFVEIDENVHLMNMTTDEGKEYVEEYLVI